MSQSSGPMYLMFFHLSEELHTWGFLSLLNKKEVMLKSPRRDNFRAVINASSPKARLDHRHGSSHGQKGSTEDFATLSGNPASFLLG